MPLPIHEAMIEIINNGIKHVDAILQDCIPKRALKYASHTNLTVPAKSIKFIPDCLHVVTPMTIPYRKYITVLGEVAFSQPEADVREQLRIAINARPEVIMVIMVTIGESCAYSTPSASYKNSESGWKTLLLEPNMRSPASFLYEYTDSQLPNVPPSEIVVADHTWFSLSSVHFQVWIKYGDNPIDLDTTDSTLTACGVSIFNF